MNMEADDVVLDRPVLATAVVAVVAGAVYVGIQIAFGDAVVPLETAVFVVVFTAVYVLGNRYLRRREREGDGDPDVDTDDPDSAGNRSTGE